MTNTEILSALDLHRKWLKGKKDGVCANLRNANLRNANLCGAYLRNANLRNTNLRGVDLCGANLCGAYLCGADLSGAYLRGANLRGADLHCANLRNTNLRGVDLSGANLCGANLRNANLRNANLCGADLSGAYLCGANLCGANLRNANLCGADLSGANLSNCSGIPPIVCPEYGAFIGWKRCGDVIVKLQIPSSAKRSSATSRKCRASKVKVLGFYDNNRKKLSDTFYNHHAYGHITEYVAGKITYPDSFNEDRWIECASGIHFFITFDEARDY